MTGYNGGITSITNIVKPILFTQMTGGTMTPKRIIGKKGRHCLYHQTPQFYDPVEKKWYCLKCMEEEQDEQILQGGYTD